ncbi:MAG: TonB-dependent receptor, partial [Spirochaetaceae bacterium]
DAELGVRPLAGLEFGPGITYRSRAYQGGDTANTLDRVDQYLLTDLFLRYRPAGLPGDLSLSAAVKNVFDISYAPFIFFGGYYPAAGRSFQIAASYRY